MSNTDAIAQLSVEKFQGAFSEAFADCVGTYHGDGKITIADLSACTGIKTRTLESYRDHESGPSGHKLMVLMEALGPRFTNRLLAKVGMGGAREMSPEEIGFHDVAEGAASYCQTFIRAMADNRIDHIERPELLKLARAMQDNLTRFLHNEDCTKPAKPRCTVTDLPKRAGGAS